MRNAKANVLKSSAGFSLVELMVVVAIIGILAAMSVGQVQKQIAKSRQAEAKTNLAQVYTAEKSFKAEYQAYATAFRVIGLGFDGNLRYNTGFAADFFPLGAGLPATTTSDGTITSATWCNLPANQVNGNAPCAMLVSNGVPHTEAAIPVAGPANSANAFLAGAIANIYQAGTIDLWTINESKAIAQPNNGIP